MPIDYGGENSDWVKLPKVGEEPKEFEIKSCERIDDENYKYNFMKKEEKELADGTKVKVDVNQGYRYVYTLKNDKKFSLSSWKPFYAFKAANVQEGDHIRVLHPAEGEWKVEIISKGTPEPTQEQAPEEEPPVPWDE